MFPSQPDVDYGNNENLCKLMTLSPAGGGGERLKAATRQFMAMQARFAGADSGSGNFLREIPSRGVRVPRISGVGRGAENIL